MGRKRLADAGLSDRVTFTIGNAEALPFPDKSFDAYTIGFGIRNVTHIDKALSEAYRVLKTGGRFLCIEFSNCEVPLLDRIYDFHSFEVIPRLGAAYGRQRRGLSLSRREHPQVSQAGKIRRHDPRGGLLPRRLPQSHRRHRGDPFRAGGLVMKLFFTETQLAHQPKQYMVHGRIVDPFENPNRATTLIASLERAGLQRAEPKDYGRDPS